MPWEVTDTTERTVRRPKRSSSHAATLSAQGSAATSNQPACADTPLNKALPEAYIPDIRVESRPHSKRSFRLSQPHPKPTPTPGGSTWHPFDSKSEYQFAQIALEASLSHRHIDILCEIIHRCVAKEDRFDIKNVVLERRLGKNLPTD